MTKKSLQPMDDVRMMIDTETIGTTYGYIVLSIGAVTFDAYGIIDEFYQEVNIDSSEELGLEKCEDSMDWWENNSGNEEFIDDMLEGAGEDVEDVFVNFTNWFEKQNHETVWAKSPYFDLQLMDGVYHKLDMESPWSEEYWTARDVRTKLDDVENINIEENENKHHALDDAKHQAKQIISATYLVDGFVTKPESEDITELNSEGLSDYYDSSECVKCGGVGFVSETLGMYSGTVECNYCSDKTIDIDRDDDIDSTNGNEEDEKSRLNSDGLHEHLKVFDTSNPQG